MTHVVLLATTRGRVLYHSHPMDGVTARVIQSSLRRHLAESEPPNLDPGERIVGPVVVYSDRQAPGARTDRAHT